MNNLFAPWLANLSYKENVWVEKRERERSIVKRTWLYNANDNFYGSTCLFFLAISSSFPEVSSSGIFIKKEPCKFTLRREMRARGDWRAVEENQTN